MTQHESHAAFRAAGASGGAKSRRYAAVSKRLDEARVCSTGWRRLCYSPNLSVSGTWKTSMAIPEYLIAILVCPACKAPVKPRGDGASLKCQSCRRVYPIRDEIPVMLIDEATIDPE
jgi:uncharacterized protein YbaR (Trm112 family)